MSLISGDPAAGGLWEILLCYPGLVLFDMFFSLEIVNSICPVAQPIASRAHTHTLTHSLTSHIINTYSS